MASITRHPLMLGLVALAVLIAAGVRLARDSPARPAEPIESPRPLREASEAEPAPASPGDDPLRVPAQRPAPDAHTEQVLALVRTIGAALASPKAEDHERGFALLLSQLLPLDPAAAGALAESWEEGAVRDELLRRVAQVWAAIDSAGAIEWAAQLADPQERRSAAADVCFQLAQTEPADAVRVAQLLGLDGQGDDLPALLQRWAARDLGAALAWAQDQPVGELRDRLMARVAGVQAETAPAEAARLVETQMAPGPVQDDARVAVLQHWAAHDAAAARRWVDQLPAGPARQRAGEELDRMEGSRRPTTPAE